MLYNPDTDRRQDHLRHRCRNPRCRSSLDVSVSNPREAFCARGCYTSFYRFRCLVCEEPIERKAEHQKLCRKSRCHNVFDRGFDLGCYYPTSTPSSTPEKSIKPGVKTRLADGRPWRVAGPPPTPSQFHCATVPDGPDCQWEGGEYRRLEAKNKGGLQAARELELEIEHAEIEAGGYFGEPGWREVISPDGVACFVTRYAIVASASASILSSASIMSPPVVGDGLDIPNFLRRMS